MGPEVSAPLTQKLNRFSFRRSVESNPNDCYLFLNILFKRDESGQEYSDRYLCLQVIVIPFMFLQINFCAMLRLNGKKEITGQHNCCIAFSYRIFR
jgi:hypothetical protein